MLKSGAGADPGGPASRGAAEAGRHEPRQAVPPDPVQGPRLGHPDQELPRPDGRGPGDRHPVVLGYKKILGQKWYTLENKMVAPSPKESSSK